MSVTITATIPRVSILLASLLLTVANAAAQPAVDLPRRSPAAAVSQDFGFTTATIRYSRPAVNDRVIWGGLVPHGRVWRAGANEATTVEFSRDVRINGEPLPKGRYSLFVLPSEEEWTFIFNENPGGWGAFEHEEKDDVLRVTVVPGEAPHRERLEYGFEDIHDGGASLYLHWEEMRGSVAVTAEFLETAKANIEWGLPNASPDDPFAWMHAARFYWVHDIDRAQALEWIDRSIAIRPFFANLWAKAQWLAETGNFTEALNTGNQARLAAESEPGLVSQLPMVDAELEEWKRMKN